MGPAGLDHWRGFFRAAGADLWDVIENGILLAAADCPEELQARRCRIAEVLFNPYHPAARGSGCDRARLDPPVARGNREGPEQRTGGGGGGGRRRPEEKQCDGAVEVVAGDGGRGVETPRVSFGVSNISYGEEGALDADCREEENRSVREVRRIQTLLEAMDDQPESVLLGSLTRLRTMGLTIEVLQATQIGKTVNSLRKHSSKQIRFLARKLVNEWRAMVDKCMAPTTALAAGDTPESVNVSCVEQNELDLPPLDEEAFLAMQATGLELSTIFDGMDEDGNLQHNGEFNKNEEISRTCTPDSPKPLIQTNNHGDDGPARKTRKLILKLTKPPATSSQATRQHDQPTSGAATLHLHPSQQQNRGSYQKLATDIQLKRRRLANGARRETLEPLDENHIQEKLETTKRRLQEGYRQAVNAKKQRATQVLSDLHNPGLENHREIKLKQSILAKGTIRRRT